MFISDLELFHYQHKERSMETFYNKRYFCMNNINDVVTMIVQRAKKISNEDFIVYGFF